MPTVYWTAETETDAPFLRGDVIYVSMIPITPCMRTSMSRRRRSSSRTKERSCLQVMCSMKSPIQRHCEPCFLDWRTIKNRGLHLIMHLSDCHWYLPSFPGEAKSRNHDKHETATILTGLLFLICVYISTVLDIEGKPKNLSALNGSFICLLCHLL